MLVSAGFEAKINTVLVSTVLLCLTLLEFPHVDRCTYFLDGFFISWWSCHHSSCI